MIDFGALKKSATAMNWFEYFSIRSSWEPSPKYFIQAGVRLNVDFRNLCKVQLESKNSISKSACSEFQFTEIYLSRDQQEKF